MEIYLATFFSHFGAVRFGRQLRDLGADHTLMPVPRRVSSSCGTCVFYQGEDPRLEAMDRDVEAVYRRGGGDYLLLPPGGGQVLKRAR